MITRAVAKTYDVAREFVGEEKDYDLPLTASEDALRNRVANLGTIGLVSLLSETAPALGRDGFSRVGSMTDDIKVDHQRFTSFVEAANNVMRIDEARESRLRGVDALTARRQAKLVAERRERNNRLIRNGVRSARERSEQYREILMGLPVEYPDVPLEELQIAYEAFHEDVVRFHAKIDQLAHMKLGASDKSSLK